MQFEDLAKYKRKKCLEKRINIVFSGKYTSIAAFLYFQRAFPGVTAYPKCQDFILMEH